MEVLKNSLNRFIIVLFLLSSCATSNYYSAQTLKKNEKAISPGVDNIVVYKPKDSRRHFSLCPSFGYIHGLPFRFETGIRLYVPYVLEGMVRHQINPPSFKAFDISANLHFGIRYFINHESFELLDKYLKPGITISKEINEYQPFLSYYRMYPEYIFKEEDSINNYFNSVITVGVAVPKKTYFAYPEINYQFFDSDFTNGIFFFGFGIRALIRKKK